MSRSSNPTPHLSPPSLQSSHPVHPLMHYWSATTTSLIRQRAVVLVNQWRVEMWWRERWRAQRANCTDNCIRAAWRGSTSKRRTEESEERHSTRWIAARRLPVIILKSSTYVGRMEDPSTLVCGISFLPRLPCFLHFAAGSSRSFSERIRAIPVPCCLHQLLDELRNFFFLLWILFLYLMKFVAFMVIHVWWP